VLFRSIELTLAGHAAVHMVQLIALVCFAAAAVGFTIRAQRGAGELDAWIACACVLAAFARAHYFVFPSLYSEWVYTGDAFRLAFYVLLLAGAARELARTQRLAHEASVFEERRRLARDLHDGLAQELGFIVMHARSRVAAGIAREELEPIARAAERAVDEARRAISALTRAIDEPLDVAIAQAVEDVAQRSGARVRLELAPDVRVEPATREELLRIAREAVSNAARHAQPNCVTVRLDANDVVRLRVSDDGRGFDPAAGRAGGHGLTSMRERARRLGGELRIESRAEQGTSVELVVPCRR
jgi:signal transduction histidine kinase